jgi:hypothetical protein
LDSQRQRGARPRGEKAADRQIRVRFASKLTERGDPCSVCFFAERPSAEKGVIAIQKDEHLLRLTYTKSSMHLAKKLELRNQIRTARRD